MAYRIKKRDRSVEDSVRRIADEQIGRALDEIDDPDLDFTIKIHQARKRCKKLRGLLRLVRPVFDDYRAENMSFRDAARLLSDVRDKRSLTLAYDDVTAHFEDEIDRRAFAPIRARLTRDSRKVHEDPDTDIRLQKFRHEMEVARDRVGMWTLDKDGFDAIADGIGKTYKRARKRMQDAWSDRDDESMHAWRKRVKYHWYHARLLSGAVPDMMRPQVDAADELSDLLGDYQDIAVLDARLRDAPQDFGTVTDLDAFRALIHQRKEALAEAAFLLGRQSLAERRKARVKRWRGYWKAWETGKAGSDLLIVEP